MSKEVKVYGKVEDGELKLNNSDMFKQSVSDLFEGKEVVVTAKQYRKARSNEQLRYYFGLVIPMIIAELEETQGMKMSKKETDKYFREAYLYEEKENFITGEIVKRTKELNEIAGEVDTLQMLLYIEQVRDWAAATLFLEIPDPDPLYKQRLEDLKNKHYEKETN